MRQADCLRLCQQLLGSKVGHVASNLAGFQTCDDGILVAQTVAGEVENANAVLHLCDAFLADNAAGGIHQRNVYGDVVRLFKDVVEVCGINYAALDVQSSIDRQIRVIADDIHAQLDGSVCHADTDGTQADDAQRLACDFWTGKVRLALFSQCADLVAVACEGLYPVCAADDVTGGQQQTAQNQFLYGICVCARGVEYDNALFRALLERDVVDTGAGTGDALESLRELQIVQLGRTN